MKKLFTTLLLLGAVGYAQAQVTVTDFDATKKTVTINYDRSAGKATEADVAKAIKDAFEGDEAQIKRQERVLCLPSSLLVTGTMKTRIRLMARQLKRQ